MADIITTSNLTVPDISKLATGDTRRRYNAKKKKKKKSLAYKLSNNKYKAGV